MNADNLTTTRRPSGRISALVLAILPISIANAQPAPAQSHAPGRVLVEFRHEVTDTQANWASMSAQSAELIPQIGVHIVRLPSSGNDQAAVQALAARPEVAFAELDEIIPPADITPNDPGYANRQGRLRKISAPTSDVFGHGTAVASTAVASSNNGIGVALVCWGCVFPLLLGNTIAIIAPKRKRDEVNTRRE